MNYFWVVFLIILIGVFAFFMKNSTHSSKISTNTVRYVAIGDSYTIGEGVDEEKRWPNLLTKDLQRNGIEIALVANPSVTGWTTQQALEEELPIYDQANPDFSTLLIGVNDWVQGVSVADFRANLVKLLDHMQQKMEKKNHLLIITIPDFSVTPTGKQFAQGRDISAGIKQFNMVIKEEAKKRELVVVDIFPLSQHMGNDPTLINPDGLHPSAKEYQLWEEKILPAAEKLLNE